MTHAEATDPDVIDARMSLCSATLDDLFPEGDAFRQSLVTYTVLLSLSGLVATFGLFQDSVASIIGAMVIARDVADLAEQLAGTLGRPVDLTVTYIPRTRVFAKGGGG